MSDGTPMPQGPSPQPQPGGGPGQGPGGPGPAKQDAPKKTKAGHPVTSVVIRPLPKAVFLYPACIGSIACGVWRMMEGTPPAGEFPSAWPGLFFLLLLGLNLFIMAFEFSRVSSMSLVFLGAMFVFMGLWIGTEYQWDVFQAIGSAFTQLNIQANPQFYFSFAGLLLFIFICIYVKTRFDYWVVTHNELLHYHGIIGNVERYPAPNLRISKEISDVFEFLLLQSGRLIIYPASELRTIVLDNVPRVNKIERALNELLSKIIVRQM